MKSLNLNEQTDQTLIEWVKTETGRLQNWAFEELVQRHQLMIYKVAHKYHFKDHDFVDKVNIFTHCLFEAIIKYDPQKETQLSTYYYQVVKHEAFLIYQHQTSQKRGGTGQGKRKTMETTEEVIPWLHVSTENLIKDDLKQFTERSNPKQNPYQQLMDHLVAHQVKEWIQEEDEINRFLLEGYLFQQQTVKTMADQLGFKHSNTSQRLHRGLGRLRFKLTQQGWAY